MNSSGPFRPKAADAAVAERTKLRREMLCILALPLDKKGRRAQAVNTAPSRLLPQCGGNILCRCRPKPLFRGDRGRNRFDFLELRLEPALEQPVEAVEIEVDHRGDIQRQ